MEKVYLSDAGPKVSPAIYSFWRWKGEESIMEEIVKFCLDLGINTFDHADWYGGYSMEENFGKLFAKGIFKRENLVLISKCGFMVPNVQRPEIKLTHVNTSASHIIRSAENSLRNLKTDYLDLFVLDYLDPISNLEESANALDKLKSSGKIRNIGVSNFTVFQHQLLESYLNSPVVSNHLHINLLDTSSLSDGSIDYVKQKYMRPLALSPLAGGDILHSSNPKHQLLRNKLQEFSIKYQADIESLAVAWILKLGALPVIGTQEIKRIQNIVNAFSIDLNHQDWFELYELSKT